MRLKCRRRSGRDGDFLRQGVQPQSDIAKNVALARQVQTFNLESLEPWRRYEDFEAARFRRRKDIVTVLVGDDGRDLVILTNKVHAGARDNSARGIEHGARHQRRIKSKNGEAQAESTNQKQKMTELYSKTVHEFPSEFVP